MVLADMGADVIRVVRPGPADIGLFVRGKRSVELDLKSTTEVERLLDLIDRADVVVEGFRPGVAERLGVGPAALTGRNPGLVYARCTGLGQTGPMRDVAGHDINYIGLAGVLSLIGPSGGRPVPPLNIVGDFAGGGLLAAFGIVCALVERGRSGAGQVVDAAMIDGSALLATMFYDLVGNGMHDERHRGANALDGGAPYYDTYETADGRWFAVGAVEGPFYTELIDRLGLDPDGLPNRWNRDRWPELRAQLADAFRRRTFEEWQDVFVGSDACATPVLLPSECPDHPHHRERGSFVDVAGVVEPAPAPRLPRTPGGVRNPSPTEVIDDALASWPSPGRAGC